MESNETCVQCTGCLDKYWLMNGQYEDCMRRSREIEGELTKMKQELEMRRQCALELKQLEECNKKLEEFGKKLENGSCAEYVSKAEKLEFS